MLSKEQKKKFELIEDLLIKIKEGIDFEQNVKHLAKLQSVPLSILSYTDMYTNNEIEYSKNILNKIKMIMSPVNDKLVDTCFKHFVNWYNTIMENTIELTTSQYKAIYWMFDRIIRRERVEDVFTMIESRGSGKSWKTSAIAVFLFIYHDKYIWWNEHKSFNILISSASEKNLQQFFGYIKDFKDRTFNKINLEGLEISRDNDELIQVKLNGIVFSEVYFRFAGISASKIEGLHVNLAFCDEMKLVSKQAFEVSILPTTNGRLGIILAFSSTDEFITYFQELCERNVLKEKADGVKRNYVVNVWDMVKERPSYAIAVKRAEDVLGRNSIAFRTQYLCEFIGRKLQSFFSIETMNELGVMKEEFDDNKYIDNPKYTIIAGFDIAMTTNNSVFTIKAVENGFGILRKTHLITQIVLNKTRNVEAENIRKQLKEIVYYIKKYKIQAILMDGTGVGKNSSLYLKELLYEDDTIEDLDFNKIIEINLGDEHRSQVLLNYYNRLNSGLEYIWKLPEGITSEDSLKRYYNNFTDYFESEAEVVRFFYEHIKFNKTDDMDKSGKQKIIFKQSDEYKLQDDTVFSSALCSYVINMFPDIQNSNGYNVGRYSTFEDESHTNYGV